MAKTKTILITGAAIRLGGALALSLAEKGWDIAIHYHRSVKPAHALAMKLTKMGRKAYLTQADLSKPQQVAHIIPSLTAQGVILDGLINNAAVFGKDNLENLTAESWGAHIDINLFAPLMLARDFAAQYAGKKGNIINITDGMAGWSLSPNFLSYSLSKKGLENATQMLALSLAPAIRVNAIAPGPTLEGAMDKKDTFAKLRRILPLKRTGVPQELCDAVHFVLTAPSLTGQILSLSGGIHLLSGLKGKVNF